MLSLLLFSTVIVLSLAKPEQGVWTVDMNKDNIIAPFMKSMYKGSQISVSVLCEGKEDVQFTVHWLLRRSPCAQEYTDIENNKERAGRYLRYPTETAFINMPYKETEYLNSSFTITCTNKLHFYIHPFKYTSPNVVVFGDDSENSTKPKDKTAVPSAVSPTAGSKTTGAQASTTNNSRKKRAVDNEEAKKRAVDNEEAKKRAVENEEAKVAAKTPATKAPSKAKKDDDPLNMLKIWEDGYYLFVLSAVSNDQSKSSDLKLQVTVKMFKGDSYIAAVDYPLLIFYGVMGLVYISFGVFWLIMLACSWRDLLRVQFWVGGVILLGMLEKAVFFAEYESINNTGQSVRGAIIVAEVVSCIKRALARMLVIIVSLGFGIVKPRLGQTLHKVLAVGLVYFILASIEGCMRALSSKSDQSRDNMLAAVPLAVTDAIICWWIFSSLLQTVRTLRLRRNVVKLSLYRHFTNTLIFAVIASIGYMIWFMTQHRFKECLTDWKELWVDEAFWHLLFSVILFIIMILWRPTANNLRYAFSPLLDAAEDDLDDEQVLSEAYEGMKMRTTKTQQRNGSPKLLETDRKLEDDLKWVEENIPSSLADKVLPVLDSDEEIMNTRFEVSKME